MPSIHSKIFHLNRIELSKDIRLFTNSIESKSMFSAIYPKDISYLSGLRNFKKIVLYTSKYSTFSSHTIILNIKSRCVKGDKMTKIFYFDW